MKIKKAIIPVAGLGTRFLPASKAQPKEMLSVVDKPIIQYIVEEAVDSGIEEIIFVTSISKRAIEDHFDRNFELEYRLEQKNKNTELRTVKEIGKLAKFAFVRQQKPLGDGHAILSAIPFIDEDEPVAVLFGDDIIDAKKPTLKQMMEVYEKYDQSVVCLYEVPKNMVSSFGVIDGSHLNKNVWDIQRFVEKPPVAKAPSNLIVLGRYILTPDIIHQLKTTKPGKDGEIRLAGAFEDHLKQGGKLLGCQFDGTWYNCGNKLGFLQAQVELGLKHPEVGKEFKKYLKTICT
ncbi:UTP--glucose-1-phosphate uridylyltransferase GalU [Patescibacteria group bacterium]|nr:UTP--glucose-1-phosphate uridylyltransferase GalU [Patescibacteria group bacterium]